MIKTIIGVILSVSLYSSYTTTSNVDNSEEYAVMNLLTGLRRTI